MHRRHLLACAFAAAGLMAAPWVHADAFPSRPLTLVAPFPAGSVTDAVTRVLAKALTQALGQSIIVENKAGAQGTIGAAFVANAKPDGYTLLVGSSGMFVAKSLYKKLSYDPMDSFVPVSGVGSTAMMFLVSPSSTLRTLADLATAAKAAHPPVSFGYGSPSGQLSVALFSTVTDSQPLAVSYRGIPQALTDMLGGQVQVAVVDIGNGLAQTTAGKARALGVLSAVRYAGAPETPTLQEAFPRAAGSLETLIGLMAPAGTPTLVVQKIDEAVRAALASPEVKAQFQTLNTSVALMSSQALQARILADNPLWEALMQQAGITPQ